jgi:hypothetical protein
VHLCREMGLFSAGFLGARAFYTDTNGTVALHLGKLAYVAPFEKTDAYYWIYVDGQNTDHNVTSTGTGQTNIVEIDLAPHFLQIKSSL